MHWIISATAAAALACSAGAAASVSAEPDPGRRCTVHGFAAGRDGVPIFAAPSYQADLAGTLPEPDPNDDMEGRMTAEFDVVEARGGWFRIENGRPWTVDLRNPPSGLSGWVFGRDVAFSLQTEMGFAEPDPASAVRYRSRDRIQPDTLALLDCRGEWVKLLFSEGGEIREGWFRGVCAIQETSCDMPPGDAYRD